MKIKHNTPELLIIDDTPWPLAIVLLLFTMAFVAAGLFSVLQGIWSGLMFIFFGGGMGLGAMAYLVERLQVILNAQDDTATLRSRTMIRYREKVLPLASVNKAIVEDTRSKSNRRGKMWRPSLVVADDGGTYVRPITEVYTGDNDARKFTQAINDWLENHRSR